MEEYTSLTDRSIKTDPTVLRTDGSDESDPAVSSSPTASLITALHDPSLQVRRVAAITLGRVGDATAIAPLNELLRHDADFELRDTISQAISAIALRETTRSPLAPDVSVCIDLNPYSEVPVADSSLEQEAQRRAEHDLARRLAAAQQPYRTEAAQKLKPEMESLLTSSVSQNNLEEEHMVVDI